MSSAHEAPSPGASLPSALALPASFASNSTVASGPRATRARGVTRRGGRTAAWGKQHVDKCAPASVKAAAAAADYGAGDGIKMFLRVRRTMR